MEVVTQGHDFQATLNHPKPSSLFAFLPHRLCSPRSAIRPSPPRPSLSCGVPALLVAVLAKVRLHRPSRSVVDRSSCLHRPRRRSLPLSPPPRRRPASPRRRPPPPSGGLAPSSAVLAPSPPTVPTSVFALPPAVPRSLLLHLSLAAAFVAEPSQSSPITTQFPAV
ncbi:hypothetical protein Scep_022203 [Stephania cephalantha]|uniref:Uncharacterized protein n=1 Tax=Stephania cephalantha TaxID=152367 RepID=A0AAP0I2H1_9MAGN